MAWLNWFTNRNKSAHATRKSFAGHSEMPSTLDSVQPGAAVRVNNAAQTASAQRLEQRRNERNAKRELLFQVVRESMVRVGVLSSAFKFKVLSLDQRGRSFLVMIELSSEFGGEVGKLGEIEAVIAHSAKNRYEIVVQAVYWRYFNAGGASASTQKISTSTAPAPLLGAMQAPISRPAPLTPMGGPLRSKDNIPSGPAPLAASVPVAAKTAPPTKPAIPQAVTPTVAPAAAPVPASLKSAGISVASVGAPIVSMQAKSSAKPTADDLSDDEVAAFRRALAAGATQGVMAASAVATTTQVAGKAAPSATLEKAKTKLLLTGYEDTEMFDDEDPMPALSGTQYGELR
jgi:hypothetical protein